MGGLPLFSIKKVILASIASVSLSASVGFGLAFGINQSNPGRVLATESLNGTITIDTSYRWADAHDDGEGCHVAVYFYAGELGTATPTNTGWSSYVYVAKDQAKTTVTYNLDFTPDYMIAVRYSNWLNETGEDSWTNNKWRSDTWGKWNQTQDLPFRENGIFIITDWNYAYDSYIYFVTNSLTATDKWIYTYGGQSQYGGWGGTAVTSVFLLKEVHGSLRFEDNDGFIYRIPILSTKNDTHVILHDNNGNQTGDMPLGHAYAYWYGVGNNAGSAEGGKAIDLLLKVEEKRLAVTETTKVKQQSICGISQSDADDLYNEYLALTDDGQSMVNRTTTYTYDPEDKTTKKNIYYSDIMTTLSVIAEGGYNANSFIYVASKNSYASIALIMMCSIATISLVSYLVLKKKRQ